MTARIGVKSSVPYLNLCLNHVDFEEYEGNNSSESFHSDELAQVVSKTMEIFGITLLKP